MYAHDMQAVLRVVLLALPLALAASACSDGVSSAPPLHGDEWPEPLEGGAVLRWQVTTPGHRFSFETDREGESIYVHNGPQELRVARTLSLEQMSRLRDDLLERNCCNLQGPWRTAESMVDWSIRMPGLSCDISMPAELFDHDELAFQECEHRLASEWSYRPRVRMPSPGSVNWPAVRATRRSSRLPPEEEPEDSE